jgi:hypothetical protein
VTDSFLWLLLLIPASAALAYLTSPESLWTFGAATLGVFRWPNGFDGRPSTLRVVRVPRLEGC